MLTEEQIIEALRPTFSDLSDTGQREAVAELCKLCMDEYRAIEQAVRQEMAADREDAERYRWLCEKLGETQLPTLIERITQGYVADYKPSIDSAIDQARKAPAAAIGEKGK